MSSSTSTGRPVALYVEDFFSADENTTYLLAREIDKVFAHIRRDEGDQIAWGLGEGYLTGRVANTDGAEMTFREVLAVLHDAYDEAVIEESA